MAAPKTLDEYLNRIPYETRRAGFYEWLDLPETPPNFNFDIDVNPSPGFTFGASNAGAAAAGTHIGFDLIKARGLSRKAVWEAQQVVQDQVDSGWIEALKLAALIVSYMARPQDILTNLGKPERYIVFRDDVKQPDKTIDWGDRLENDDEMKTRAFVELARVFEKHITDGGIRLRRQIFDSKKELQMVDRVGLRPWIVLPGLMEFISMGGKIPAPFESTGEADQVAPSVPGQPWKGLISTQMPWDVPDLYGQAVISMDGFIGDVFAIPGNIVTEIGRAIPGDVGETFRSVGNEASRVGSRIGREVERVGTRIGKEVARTAINVGQEAGRGLIKVADTAQIIADIPVIGPVLLQAASMSLGFFIFPAPLANLLLLGIRAGGQGLRGRVEVDLEDVKTAARADIKQAAIQTAFIAALAAAGILALPAGFAGIAGLTGAGLGLIEREIQPEEKPAAKPAEKQEKLPELQPKSAPKEKSGIGLAILAGAGILFAVMAGKK